MLLGHHAHCRIAGWSAAAIAALLLPAANRAAAPATPVDPPVVEEVVVSAPEPRYVAPTTRDRIGRIWAPVLINGRGPYRLVLDTGASRSAIVQRVADDLALPVRPDAIRLRGVTGTAIAPAVQLDTLQFGELAVTDTLVPIVADAFGGADGVLGGEGLEGKRIQIEFRRDRVSIARSKRFPAQPGYSVVPFRYGPTRGMRIEVLVGAVKAVGVIDTRVQIPSITAGELIVKDAEIAFSDLYIFEHWQLATRPALLIGMDVLGVLDTLVIDYGLNQLQVRTRR